MMRVGTQRRSKSNSSPTGYRQSPSQSYRYNSPSPTSHNSLYNSLNKSYSSQQSSHHNMSSPINTSHNTSKSSYSSYRENASPVYSSSNYHKTTAEKRISSDTTFEEHRNTGSPNFIPRVSSPSLAPRATSPGFPSRPLSPAYCPRTQSPDYITSKRLNDRRNDTPTSGYSKKGEYETIYSQRSLSPDFKSKNETVDSDSKEWLRREDSNSPDYVDGGGYTTTTVNEHKRRTETKVTKTHYTDTSSVVRLNEKGDKVSGRRTWDEKPSIRNSESQREYEYSQSYFGGSNDGTKPSLRIGGKGAGASAIRVGPISGGEVGHPVEFESKYNCNYYKMEHRRPFELFKGVMKIRTT